MRMKKGAKKLNIIACLCAGVGALWFVGGYFYNKNQGNQFQDGYWISEISQLPLPENNLPDGAFDYKEIPIDYVSKADNANPDGCIELISTYSQEEHQALQEQPAFWFFKEEITDKRHPNGLEIEYPLIEDNQELILSYGREIIRLRYTEASMYPGFREEYESIADIGTYSNELSRPYCIPVMSKEYEPNTVYFYTVSKTALAPFPDQSIRPCLIFSKCFEIES